MDESHVVFSELDGTAPFHRDTALGRVFHPGTLSFREIATSDSLHITVAPGNRVSVHVDRLSPLAVRPGRPCRYSLLRAIAHNVVHVFDAGVLFCRRRRAAHRCELECEVTGARRSAQAVYEFSCRAAGAEGCGWSVRATSEEELVVKVADHARRVHRVSNLTDTIQAYALDVARRQGA